MRAPISVIIPTLNSASGLAAMVSTLFEGLEAGLIRELIVSDGGSGDATLEIAGDLGAEITRGAAGRGGQMRQGAEMAQGAWLLFLHSDTWLDEGWSAAVISHLRQHEQAACFRLRFRAKGRPARIVAGWANLRTRVFGLPYGDQGLLISRALYDQIGGFQDIPLMEDVAIARKLKRRLVMLDGVALTNADKYIQGGWFRQGARNFWTLLRYFAGVSPENLAKRY
ncbi:MAG: glycosyltransferase [Alphaproteobacteria bacterium]|nr:glycosyltransferase [Alphaproteobacteria bacterium]